MATDGRKLSFAKVAASATRTESIPLHTSSHIVDHFNSAKGSSESCNSTTTTASPATSTTAVTNSSVQINGSGNNPEAQQKGPAPTSNSKVEIDLAKVNFGGAMEQKTLSARPKAGVLDTNGTVSVSTDKATKAVTNALNHQISSSSDKNLPKADSDSELGTKPASLDGKSITSGTTFNALDEKESLRPDDSASVKAAAEDDDAFSVRGSLLVNSRLGSDVAARVHRIQIGDMPPRTVPHISTEPIISGVNTPHSTSSEQQPVTEARVQLATNTTTTDAMNGLLGQNPDEKLLEAMQSPKDRIFLLRLENDVVNFVQNSKEPFMDLPPSNSFCRMLTHKLADYYRMTHSFEAVAGSVRIYRTPFCRVPPPLSSLVASSSSKSSTPPPVVQPKKIMRRGEAGDLPLSAGPSKPTSEADSDSKDKVAPAKEKLSREAREEAYNKARERIFGSSILAEVATPDNDDGTGVSRASSVSAKDKTLNKKGKTSKQRRDDPESFDSRSQYTPFYNHPQQPTWMPPQYMPVAHHQFNAIPMQLHPPQATLQQSPPQQPQGMHFANPASPQLGYSTSATGYPLLPPRNSLSPQGVMSQYPQPPVPPRCPLQSSSSASCVSNGQTGILSQQWQQPLASYQPNVFSTPPPRPTSHPVGIPYAYGQLPANANPSDPKSQHPIPGSYAGNYNRHAFNPKTQSFVPGNGLMPAPFTGPQGPYGPTVADPITPHTQGQPQSASSFNGAVFHKAAPPGSLFVSAVATGYGMVSQSSNKPGPPCPPNQPSQASQAYQSQAPQNSMPLGQRHGLPAHGPTSLIVQNNSPRAQLRGPSAAPSMMFTQSTATPSREFPHTHQRPSHSLPPQPTKGQPSMHGSAGSSPSFSHLPKYGNPATLPQKPAGT